MTKKIENYKALGLAICAMLSILGGGYLINLWASLTLELPMMVFLSPFIIGGVIILYWAIKNWRELE